MGIAAMAESNKKRSGISKAATDDDDDEELKPVSIGIREDDKSPKHSALHSLSFQHLLHSCKEKEEALLDSDEADLENSVSTGRTHCRGSSTKIGNRPPIPGLAVAPKPFKPVSIIFTPANAFAPFPESADEALRAAPASHEPSPRSRSIILPFVGELKWESVKKMVREWLRNPKNWALLVWGISVGISGAILFMVMVGMLNAVLPEQADRDLWFEASNQTINALFTLLVLYLHPTRMLHLLWLLRWRPEDIIKLRTIYCKSGMRKPQEWSHMLVVVLLLHLNCFSQYALCGLNWGYRRADRPVAGVAFCLLFAIGAGCAAGVYNSRCPLGRDFVPAEDDDATDKAEKGALKSAPPTFFRLPRKYRLLERRMTFAAREGKVVEHPDWQGGLLDCCEAPKVATVTTCCFACVLGYNLDRLGFGNRYVHVSTFLLVCFAPFLVFDIAATNIDNRAIRQSLEGAGIIISICGLLYGGYWRIQMRQRYILPANTSCCGQANMTDCAQWLFCSCCSLCQEVRTADAFDVIDNKFYVKSQARADSPGCENTPDPVLVAPVPASSIRPLPVSDVRKIKESELSAAHQTMFASPPIQPFMHSDVAYRF